jgi:antitoxin HicB
MDIRYPAKIEAQAPSGYLVSLVDLEDTFTEGATKEEALFNASEVLFD